MSELLVHLAWVVASLTVLAVGAELLVRGSVALAERLRISSFVIGLTVVGFGTSTPELFTSVAAALRNAPDLAVGNVVGSNIFNVLLCLGAAALAGSVGTDLHAVRVDLAMLIGMTVLLAVFIRTERVIKRFEAAIVLALYCGFTAWIVVFA